MSHGADLVFLPLVLILVTSTIQLVLRGEYKGEGLTQSKCVHISNTVSLGGRITTASRNS